MIQSYIHGLIIRESSIQNIHHESALEKTQYTSLISIDHPWNIPLRWPPLDYPLVTYHSYGKMAIFIASVILSSCMASKSCAHHWSLGPCPPVHEVHWDLDPCACSCASCLRMLVPVAGLVVWVLFGGLLARGSKWKLTLGLVKTLHSSTSSGRSPAVFLFKEVRTSARCRKAARSARRTWVTVVLQ